MNIISKLCNPSNLYKSFSMYFPLSGQQQWHNHHNSCSFYAFISLFCQLTNSFHFINFYSSLTWHQPQSSHKLFSHTQEQKKTLHQYAPRRYSPDRSERIIHFTHVKTSTNTVIMLVLMMLVRNKKMSFDLSSLLSGASENGVGNAHVRIHDGNFNF